MLLFRKWDTSGIEIIDPGLKTSISLRNSVLPYTYGRSALKRFNKNDTNIVERLANKLMHFGKKYAKNTGRMAGKKTRAIKTVKAAFTIIELKTGKNPVEVLVRAVEMSAPNEDTTRIVYGGTVYHVSVDVSPIRRVDLALFIADQRSCIFKSSTGKLGKPSCSFDCFYGACFFTGHTSCIFCVFFTKVHQFVGKSFDNVCIIFVESF